MDEAENEINDLEHKEAKNNQSEQQEEKKNKKLEVYLKKTVKENFSNLVKEIDMQFQETESPKQDGCKEAHSKTHHN